MGEIEILAGEWDIVNPWRFSWKCGQGNMERDRWCV